MKTVQRTAVAIVRNNIGDEFRVSVNRREHCPITCLNAAAIRSAICRGLPASVLDIDDGPDEPAYQVDWQLGSEMA